MPYKAMTGDEQVVFLPKIHKLVGQCKVKFSFFWLNLAAFHAVFRNNGTELFFHNTTGSSVFFGNLKGVECSTNVKFALISIFQCGLPCGYVNLLKKQLGVLIQTFFPHFEIMKSARDYIVNMRYLIGSQIIMGALAKTDQPIFITNGNPEQFDLLFCFCRIRN